MATDNENREHNLPIKYRYNQYLLNDTPLPSSYFSPNIAHITAKIILRYAVEEYLRWSPYDMRDNLNRDVLEKLKLYHICKKHLAVDFPKEFDINKDYFYFAHICYPNTIKFDPDVVVVKHYQNILDGKEKKFKKGFLVGVEGEHRIKVCFKYLLEKLGFTSIKEMYATFATTQGTKLLDKYKLTFAKRYHYQSTIDYLHDVLPSSQKNIDYYNYYRIINSKDFKRLDDKVFEVTKEEDN